MLEFLSHLFHLGRDFWFYLLCILSVCIVVPFAYSQKVKKFIPPVVTFIGFGIILGPTVLGRFIPEWQIMLTQNKMSDVIYGLSGIGLILIGMRTGFEIEPQAFRGQGKSFLSMLVFNNLGPFLVGLILSYYFLVNAFPEFVGSAGTPLLFSATMGISLAVTALPVLVLLLKGMHMSNTYAGRTSLGLAGAGDPILWTGAAGVILIASSNAGGVPVMVMRVFLFIAYLVVMFRFVKPFMAKRYENVRSIKDLSRSEEGTRAKKIAWLLLILFGSVIATEAIGMHGLLGAFVFGIVTPHDLRKAMDKMVKGLLEAMLLPFFFISTGLKVSFDITSPEIWIFAGLLSVGGILAKLFFTAVAAQATGVPKREAYTVGSLMVAAGLMEVAFATIVLEAKIIGPLAFSALIIMAIIRTVMTEPMVRIVKWLIPATKKDHEFLANAQHSDDALVVSSGLVTAEAEG